MTNASDEEPPQDHKTAPPAAPEAGKETRRPHDATIIAPFPLSPDIWPTSPTHPPGAEESRRDWDLDTQTRIRPGSVLNHIYEVRRFIARGGMGEVFEGINVNSDERVAIKVILPHLAQDPKIQALFRKEARTLTGLTHPALVQYRVLAQEPALGVSYIVTEFVDGCGLDEVIGEITPDEAALRGLTRRLAEGLKAAHELGAIHRDISPDNILLPDRRLDQAKIIDFGIAKDLGADNATMVGEAFAGKLSFAAPEQIGDFGRQIGPWTDVYSLALVILALAAGSTAPQGETLVEAVDRRRAGPDLNALPEGLRPAFARMLEPDPKRRLRTMAEVLAALDAPLPKGPVASAYTVPAAVAESRPSIAASRSGDLVLGLIALVLIAGLVGLVIVKRSGFHLTRPPARMDFTTALDPSLRALPCAWLSLEASSRADGPHLGLSGAAGDPAAARAQMTDALRRAGQPLTVIDRAQIQPVAAAACGTLSALTHFHSPSAETPWLRALAPHFYPLDDPICGDDPLQSATAMTITPPNLAKGEDIGLYRLDDSGALTRLFAGLAEFKALARRPNHGEGYRFEDLGAHGLRVTLCEKTPGLKGVVMIRGRPPFGLGLPAIITGRAGDAADLPARLLDAGKAQGWRDQMIWYDVAAPPALSPPSITGARAALTPHPHHAVHAKGHSQSGAIQPPSPPPQPHAPAKPKPDPLGADFR